MSDFNKLITTKRSLILNALALFSCIAWGVITLFCAIIKDYFNLAIDFNHSLFASNGYPIYRIMYFLRVLLFLPILLEIYKKYFQTFDYPNQRLYIQCMLLAMVFLIGGLFLKTKFWNYLLDGCLISPLLEEIIARFVLYEARSKGFKSYVLASILSSLSFGVMHFFYNPSTLMEQAAILPKLSEHFVFGLILCGVFWFFPNLRLLILIHSFSNLWSILATASELRT